MQFGKKTKRKKEAYQRDKAQKKSHTGRHSTDNSLRTKERDGSNRYNNSDTNREHDPHPLQVSPVVSTYFIWLIPSLIMLFTFSILLSLFKITVQDFLSAANTTIFVFFFKLLSDLEVVSLSL